MSKPVAPTGNDPAVERIVRAFADQGLLIQAGFFSYNALVIPKEAGPVQRAESRKAFFAGAQHLFRMLTGELLEEDEEPTDNDLKRIALIAAELDKFAHEVIEPLMPKPGRA